MTQPITQFQLTYELCPIILNGGIAGNVPGGQLPIISLTQAQDFSGGILQSSDPLTLEDFVAHFTPMPGSTLAENQVGMYPFANQQVAANAIIVQPLRISLMMLAPAPAEGGYPLKLAAFSSLVQQLGQHDILGGTYTISTPAYIYTNCLRLAMRDVSNDETKQVQVRWQWDFIQPLLTQQQAAQSQNSLISKITGGTQIVGDPPTYSGTANTVGQPNSGIAPPLIPAGQQAGGSSVPVGNPVGQ